MDAEANSQQEKMRKLRELLDAVESDRLAGKPGCTLDELDRCLEDLLSEL